MTSNAEADGPVRPKTHAYAARPRVRRIVAGLWRGRGFFGGLLALWLGWQGQQALLSSLDYSVAFQYYTLAAVLLIASFLHPSFPARLFKKRAAPISEPASSENSSPADAPPAIAEQGIEPGVVTVELRGAESPARITGEERDSGASQETPSTDLQAIASVPEAPPIVYRSYWSRWKDMRAKLGWRLTAPGLAITLALTVASALVLFQDYRLATGGWLWAAALSTLVLTMLGVRGWPADDGLLPGTRSDFFGAGVPEVPRRLEALAISGILLGALLLRTIDLENMPGVEQDEAFQALDARAIKDGGGAPLFGNGWYWVPNLSFYLMSFMLRIFGDNMVGARMLSVISGLVMVWFVYRTGRLLWGALVGLIAGAMLAVSPLALQYSRVLNVTAETGALWAAGFFYFFMALRYRRWSDWVVAGFCWALNLYFYPAGKLIIPLIGLLGLYCLIRWRGLFFRRYLLGFVLLGFAFALVFMPYAIFSFKFDNWQGFSGRAQQASIFAPHLQQEIFVRNGVSYDPAWAADSTAETLLNRPLSWAQVIYQQMRITAEVLYARPDGWGFYKPTEHNGSMFSPFWAVLAVLGLVYAAWKFWDPRYGLVSLWFWTGMAGMALMYDIPNVLRASGAWSAVMLFPAVLVDRVFAAAWPMSRTFARRWASLPVVALVIYLAADSYREYFGHWASLCYQCRVTTQARYVQALGQDYKAYEAAIGSDVSFVHPTTAFIARGVEGIDMLTTPDFFPITDNNGKGAAFLIYTHMYQYLPILKTFYPGGTEEQIRSPDGVEIFTSYKLTREQIAAFQTTNATYTSLGDSAAAPVVRAEPNLGTAGDVASGALNWTPPQGLAYPATVNWQGGIVAPTYGSYIISIDGTLESRLEVDGRTYLDMAPATRAQVPGSGIRNVEVVLAKGLHSVRLTATLRDPAATVAVTWAGSGSTPVPIESRFLYNGPTGGLSGEVAPLTDIAKLGSDDPLNAVLPTSRRSDPFLGFRLMGYTFGNTPSVARWQGYLKIEIESDYSFRTEPSIPGVVYIDGQLVAGQGPVPAPGVVRLAAGTHTIDVRQAWQPGGPETFELYYAPSGGQQTLIPPTALSPLIRSWLRGEMPAAPPALVPAPVVPAQELKPVAVIASGSGLSDPHGVGVDKNGNIYVGDSGNKRIVVYAPDGKILRTIGSGPPPESEQNPGPGQFRDVRDIAVAPDGIVHALDAATARVQSFDASGKLLRAIDARILGMYGPNGIALAPDGSLYVADTGQNRVLKIAPTDDGLPLQLLLFPNPTNAQPPPDTFEQPLDVLVRPQDNNGLQTILVVDLKKRLVELSADGSTVRQWMVPVGAVSGGSKLALSSDGRRIYISDPDLKRLTLFDTGQARITFYGRPGAGDGQFEGPSGIAVGPDDKIYVLDRINGNVQVFAPPPDSP